VGGSVDTICFDKTGTLTEDKIVLKGVIDARDFSKMILKNEPSSLLSRDALDCMSVCHSVIYLKNKLLGDPMEIEMFQYSGGTLINQNSDEQF